MKQTTLKTTALGLVICGIAAGVWLFGLQRRAPKLTWQWQERTLYTFSLNYTSQGNTHLVGLASLQVPPSGGAPQVISDSMHATLEINMVSRSKDSTHLLWRLRARQASTFVDNRRIDRDCSVDAMGCAFTVDMGERGDIRGLTFADVSTSLDRNEVRALLSQLQVTLPQEPAHSWKTTESDLHGAFHASYTLNSDRADAPHLEKKADDAPTLSAIRDATQLQRTGSSRGDAPSARQFPRNVVAAPPSRYGQRTAGCHGRRRTRAHAALSARVLQAR